MKQHKWHKEIKAWADGAEIERREGKGDWKVDEYPTWLLIYEYRIKPQPKEQQYLYAYFDYKKMAVYLSTTAGNTVGHDYIGKIKLEQDDE